jgi:hypothetical protein
MAITNMEFLTYSSLLECRTVYNLFHDGSTRHESNAAVPSGTTVRPRTSVAGGPADISWQMAITAWEPFGAKDGSVVTEYAQ